MPEQKRRFKIERGCTLATKLNEVQYIAVTVYKIFRNYFHQAAAACENNLRHLHCRKHNNQPDDNIKEPEDFPIIVRRNSFKANTPHHANNDNDINKQHGGGDIFAGVQRLTKDVVKRRQTKPDAQ